MEPPPPPRLSRTTTNNILLNRYELGRLLGRGSFAKVYAARPLNNNNNNNNNNTNTNNINGGCKTVAIKVIDKTKSDVAILEPRIVSEITAMKRLNDHPNILKIHEVMATKTKIFLVMELAANGDLFSKILRRGRLTESAARRFFLQLLSGLRFCHLNGVSHRDLKPHNILLDESNSLKITDFGLSSLLKNGDEGGSVLYTACGTPAFTAPEVFSRRGYDGAKADAWSCGVVLYFLLCGSLPFDDSNIAAMYKNIYRREYKFPSFVSRPARAVINQLLDPNPNTRLGVEALASHSWVLNKVELPVGGGSNLFFGSKLDRLASKSCGEVNAFDIISLSSGLDLSGLFEGCGKREKRFTSGESVEKVRESVREVGGRLGYTVGVGGGGGGGGVIGLGKGRVLLVFEALEITEKVVFVEVKVAQGGGMEFDDLCWEELKDGLQDVVLQWHSDVS